LQTNGNLPLPFSVCCKQTEVAIFRWFLIRYKYRYIYTVPGIY
jgi:hypothetical protein